MPNYRMIAQQAAAKYNIPVAVFDSLVNQESGWNPNATSPVGAHGFTQLMPDTARGLGVDPSNPVQNLYGGAKYLRDQLNRFGGNMEMALAAYNAGPGAVAKYGGVPPYAETQAYVKSIMARAKQLESGGGVQPMLAATVPGTAPPQPTQPSAPPPTVYQGPSLQSTLNQAAPDTAETSILQNLGGTAANVAQSLAQSPIQLMPSPERTLPRGSPLPKTIGQTPGGLKIQTDFPGPVHPGVAPVVKLAEHYLGTPYRWGGANPKTGFDCSGFVQWLYGKEGINLPRTTYQQVNVGKPIKAINALKPGDIIFFSQNGDVHHEGLYIGNGQFIHAPHTGDVVKVSSLSDPYYAKQFVGGRRVTRGGKK